MRDSGVCINKILPTTVTSSSHAHGPLGLAAAIFVLAETGINKILALCRISSQVRVRLVLVLELATGSYSSIWPIYSGDAGNVTTECL